MDLVQDIKRGLEKSKRKQIFIQQQIDLLEKQPKSESRDSMISKFKHILKGRVEIEEEYKEMKEGLMVESVLASK